MSRKPGKYLRKVLILHAEWLKANGYPEQQATSCKQQAIKETVPYNDIKEAQPEVASDKPQAPSEESHKPQASSDKQQAS